MLTNAIIAPTIPVVDLARARKFYEEKLGLKPFRVDAFPPGVLYEGGDGTRLCINQRGATKAERTVAAFQVEDVEKTVKERKGKGVVFEEVDMPQMGLKTINSIATRGTFKSAWFKDTDGNILAVTQLRT